MDISDPYSVYNYMTMRENDIDLIVHAAAYTRTFNAETSREECWNTNVGGPQSLGRRRLPMLLISTEYVFDGEKGLYTEEDFPNPKNYYALTKLIGEQMSGPMTKIVRLIFKPRPWPFPMAYTDQFTSGDYIDVMAEEVNKAIDLFDKLRRVTHLGTGRKSMYALAKETRVDVLPNSITSSPIKIPPDCSLDISRWTHLKQENGIK